MKFTFGKGKIYLFISIVLLTGIALAQADPVAAASSTGLRIVKIDKIDDNVYVVRLDENIISQYGDSKVYVMHLNSVPPMNLIGFDSILDELDVGKPIYSELKNGDGTYSVIKGNPHVLTKEFLQELNQEPEHLYAKEMSRQLGVIVDEFMIREKAIVVSVVGCGLGDARNIADNVQLQLSNDILDSKKIVIECIPSTYPTALRDVRTLSSHFNMRLVAIGYGIEIGMPIVAVLKGDFNDKAKLESLINEINNVSEGPVFLAIGDNLAQLDLGVEQETVNPLFIIVPVAVIIAAVSLVLFRKSI